MLRRLLLVFLALWLPIQAGAALASSLAMDVEPHPAHDPSQAGMAHDYGAVPQHAAHVDEGAVQHDSHEHGAGCERCGLCQFVHGGVMLNAGADLPAVVVPPVFLTLGDERFTAHIPDLLQRPPLSAA